MTLHATRNQARGTVTVNVAYGPVRIAVEEHESHARSFAMQVLRLVPDTAVEEWARKGYERYIAHCNWMSVHGEPLPAWDEMDEKVQEHWIAAFTE